MRCPFCRHPDSRVIDSREVDDGQAIRRRRVLPGVCAPVHHRRGDGAVGGEAQRRHRAVQPAKVVAGVRRACQGRPVDEDALALLAQQVEDAVRATGCAEVPSQEVGLAILGPLRDLDEVAYLRFASVYRAFTSADDFIAEIRDAARRRPTEVDRATPGRRPRRDAASPPRPPVAGQLADAASGRARRRSPLRVQHSPQHPTTTARHDVGVSRTGIHPP